LKASLKAKGIKYEPANSAEAERHYKAGKTPRQAMELMVKERLVIRLHAPIREQLASEALKPKPSMMDQADNGKLKPGDRVRLVGKKRRTGILVAIQENGLRIHWDDTTGPELVPFERHVAKLESPPPTNGNGLHQRRVKRPVAENVPLPVVKYISSLDGDLAAFAKDAWAAHTTPGDRDWLNEEYAGVKFNDRAAVEDRLESLADETRMPWNPAFPPSLLHEQAHEPVGAAS
jgi:hypothetical protein